MEMEYGETNLGEEELIKHAEQLMGREMWADARILLERNYDTTFNSTVCMEKLGYCCSKLEDYPKAIEIFEELCKRESWKAKWWNYLAFQKKMVGDMLGAIVAYQKCNELSPNWLNPYLELGKIYESLKSKKSIKDALETYRQGIKIYRENDLSRQRDIKKIYSQLCTRTAMLLMSINSFTNSDVEVGEIENLLKEASLIEPSDVYVWYRLGCYYLKIKKYERALENLEKAQVLRPNSEIVKHKIAQVYLNNNDPDKALRIYETIQEHKKTSYIYRGMAQCFLLKGNTKEAANYLYKAVKKEFRKSYLHKELAFVLIDLGDRDQAAKELQMANKLYNQEFGHDDKEVLGKIEEIKEIPQGATIIFEDPPSSVVEISHGLITKYVSEKGFGFIKDSRDNASVFFHITKFKKGILPSVGDRVRFIRETGDKGPQVSKAWIDHNK